jgi:hypothetical protein
VSETRAAIDKAFASSSLPSTILNTVETDEVAFALAAWCEDQLGATLERVFSCEISVGVVFGVTIADGRRLAIKAHQPNVPPARLRAIQSAQGRLAEAGFPCPLPAAAPATLCGTLATAEAWLDGPPGDFDRPGAVSASAAALSVHIRILRPLSLDLPPTIAGVPWPPAPHNELFDFSDDVQSAAWIDEIALQAKALLDVGDVVTGHADWSAKHVRLDGDRVVATYDWDSLRREREPVLAGFAAASHHVHLDPASPWRAEPDRVRSYLDAYERQRTLTPAEQAAALAAAVYLYAYTARCEHGYVGPGEPVTNIRETLAGAAEALLGRA